MVAGPSPTMNAARKKEAMMTRLRRLGILIERKSNIPAKAMSVGKIMTR
jgi:hypothetical protein